MTTWKSLWKEDEAWRHVDAAQERAQLAAFRAVIDYAAQVAVEGRLERYGDGQGAVLFMELEEALERHLGHPLHPERQPGPKPRSPISATKRVAIFARDGYQCVECGETDPESLSLDHIVPWSKGGSDEARNLRTLCRPCNSSKGTKDI